MQILLTGASGLIGSALAPLLAADGHNVIKLRRTPTPADSLGPSWDPMAGKIKLDGTDPIDAVINLAGENIAQRWTAAAKARIRNSRVDSTKLLSEALVRLPYPPKVFISASATGYYGNRGDELLDEQSVPGIGFLAEVCREWEAATQPASQQGVRVVNLRLGIVLTAKGGALGKMLRPFRLGLGGKLGNGEQYWSWVTMDDLLAIIRHILANDGLSGPVNAVSPGPITNAEFTRTLGVVLRRPAFFNLPALAVNLLFGEMGKGAMLASCRARPTRLEQTGFAFQFPKVEGGLRRLIAA
jgi:uncharacterized protein (TIGR01777 family)